jgi:general secretion pathway protein I
MVVAPTTARLRSAGRRPTSGFSLLEVMVAIAILGLTLTVILSAQGGLAASNRSAANMGQAVQLGRCKMTEIEEQLLKLGYQEIDQIETAVPCCLDATPENFICDTKIEKVELPNMNTGNSLGDGGSLLGASSALLGPNNAAGGPGLNLAVDGGMQGLGQLASQFGPGGAGADGMLTMVMGMLYPSIKPMYEASIRRVTVTVRWKEGPNERDLPLTQFVTNPQRGGFAGSSLMADGGVMDFGPAPTGSGAPGGSPSPGAGTGGGTGGLGGGRP